MAQFESSVKHVPYPQENVYRNISDLNNLERIRDRVPADKVDDFSFDSDTVSVSMPPVGKVTLRIVDRDEPKCVKFESVQSPIPFNLWIQVLPVDAQNSKMKVTVKADIPLVLRAMLSSPLQEGVEKVAEALSQIQYL